MNLIATIAELAKERGLKFLIIGGHAINAYGIGRQTADLDLLACQFQAEGWKTILAQLGYSLAHGHQTVFLQFEPDGPGHWPVDLMLVDDETFAQFAAESQEFTPLGTPEIRVPSAMHLIALKLHALKQVGIIREMQDLPAIIGLIRTQQLEYDTEEFRNFCLRYGTPSIHARIIDQLENEANAG